jgi:hypothetical protein
MVHLINITTQSSYEYGCQYYEITDYLDIGLQKHNQFLLC